MCLALPVPCIPICVPTEPLAFDCCEVCALDGNPMLIKDGDKRIRMQVNLADKPKSQKKSQKKQGGGYSIRSLTYDVEVTNALQKGKKSKAKKRC